MATYRRDPEGAWFAGIRGRVILLVPKAAASDLAALWPALTDADPTSQVLDRLTASGLAATPPFALVVRDHDGSAARVVVRGPIVARSGAAEIHGAGVSTWVERVVDDASAVTVEVEGVDTLPGEPLPVVEAVVAALAISSDGAEPVAPDSARALPTAVEPSPVESVPAAPSTASATPTPFEPPSLAAPSTATVPPPPAPRAPAEQTMVPAEETIASSQTLARASAQLAPALAPVAELDGDHDGMTVASIDIRRLRAERAARVTTATPANGTSAASAPSAASAASMVSIRLPDGSLEPIGHEVVLGRAPSVSKISGGRIPRLVTIGLGDPDISRSHVRLALEADTVVVTDLHSRNGTHVAQPGKAPVKLRAGEPTPVLAGTVIDFGGGWTIQVVAD